MKRTIGLSILMLWNFSVVAQRVHWASKVLRVSSEFPGSEPTNKAIQVLGKPNTGAQGGPSAAAWQPANPDSGEEFIKVSFDTLVLTRQIIVHENLGAGCLLQIWGLDGAGKEKLLFSNSQPAPTGPGKIWSIPLSTPFPVKTLGIVLNTARKPGFSQIDAIGVSSDATPYTPKINLGTNRPAQSYVKENLGPAINSSAQELNPIISADGKHLFFTRWDHPENMGEAVVERGDVVKRKKQDIWYSTLVNGVWQKAVNMGKPFNNDDHNAILSISADLKKALLLNEYRPDGTMSLGVSTSVKGKDGWSFPKPEIIDDFNGSEDDRWRFTEYCMSPSEKILLMAVDRPGDTFGNRDLYVSFLQSNGHWSAPKNLGKDINTAEVEASPFIAADEKTIYFTSKGWPGYGNSDIFVSHRLDDTWQRWSTPENLGPEINTPGWDRFFNVPASGEYAYFSSTTTSNENDDIFRIRIAESLKPETVVMVSGHILNAITRKPMQGEVFAHALQTKGDSVHSEYNPETGEYKLVLPVKKLYSLHSSKKGFLSASDEVDLREEKRYREIRKDLLLTPIQTGAKVVLNTVYFQQSSARIDSVSYPELNRIARTMLENPGMEILLEGHTDNLGDFNANILLSQTRVENVKKYLVGQGVDTKRITYKGYGSSRPITNTYTEESRRKNRRVEFVITKKE